MDRSRSCQLFVEVCERAQNALAAEVPFLRFVEIWIELE